MHNFHGLDPTSRTFSVAARAGPYLAVTDSRRFVYADVSSRGAESESLGVARSRGNETTFGVGVDQTASTQTPELLFGPVI